MASILPSIKDRYRNKANGKRRYVGQVLMFDGARKPVRSVLAEVYGDTLEEMRQRKQAITKALLDLERKERKRRGEVF